jgi:transposase
MNRDDVMKLDKSEIIEIVFATLAIVEEQSKQINQLNVKIAELEARLNQNSTNSSRPPSSDVFPRPVNPRKPSGKKR